MYSCIYTQIRWLLTHAPTVYSRTLHANGGGEGRFAPPIVQTNKPILDPKTAYQTENGLIAPGFNFPNTYVAKLYLDVTDDVTGRVKGQIF